MKARVARISEADWTPSEQASSAARWVRLGDEVLLLGERPEELSRAIAGTGEVDLGESVEAHDLRLVTQIGNLFRSDHPDVSVLVDKGRYLVVDVAGRDLDGPPNPCWAIEPLPLGTAVFETRGRPTSRGPALKWVQELVDQVALDSFRSTLQHLVSFATRHSTSADYAAAAAEAQDQLNAFGYATKLEAVAVDNGASRNVVADKRGEGPSPRRVVVVVAHLDSVNTAGDPAAPAPGADDNGSGSSGLLEIARVLQAGKFQHDLRLVLFGGEEQGLHGSRQHVLVLSSEERKRIVGVVNMDMIAGRNMPVPTVLIEGSPLSQALIDASVHSAGAYTSLSVETSLRPFNSDHVSFLDAGIPSVLTIEASDEANKRVHTAKDTMAHVDTELALEIVRMNVATVAAALGAPRGAEPGRAF